MSVIYESITLDLDKITDERIRHIAGACAALSDWEVDEARLDWQRHGTPLAALAGRYGVSARTLERAFKRMDEKMGVIA